MHEITRYKEGVCVAGENPALPCLLAICPQLESVSHVIQPLGWVSNVGPAKPFEAGTGMKGLL